MNRLRQWCARATEEETAYFLAAVSLALCVAISVAGHQLGFRPQGVIFLLPFCLFIYGFLQFASVVWASAKEKPFVKGLYSFLILIVGAFIVAFSSVATNTVLQAPSSAFPHTRAFVGALSLPMIVILAMPIVGIISSPAVLLASILSPFPRTLKELVSKQSQRSERRGGEVVVGVRFATTLVLLAIFLAGLPLLGPYSNWVGEIARWYAYHFEAEQFSHCRLLPEQRIVYVGDDYVVRVKPDDQAFKFELGLCESQLSQDIPQTQ